MLEQELLIQEERLYFDMKVRSMEPLMIPLLKERDVWYRMFQTWDDMVQDFIESQAPYGAFCTGMVALPHNILDLLSETLRDAWENPAPAFVLEGDRFCPVEHLDPKLHLFFVAQRQVVQHLSC